ncbi:superoxide dismutase [Asanoa sp. WMMD1127]|uniref:SMP-30/gluconolactonase/LRE family protein n=1 Tax=Asanoa sp. WMMD1127 TaxID=3016107 RepID=UPI0024167698|nr:superoxide dismutase [Asanoa sp. WMMD1127]MDG4827382.1 superoxide dismutase [Asanoa sp. WMMD1127]
MRHRVATIALGLTAALAATLLGPAGTATAHDANHDLFPTTIQLPNGFQPEGIAIGTLPYAFFGSRVDGAIYRASLVTGRGEIINPGFGSGSLGLKLDGRGRLFVAGQTSGDGRVVDAVTGRTLKIWNFTDGTSFVNDVILTPDAAWFTDSQQPVLYKVPFGRFGTLGDRFETVPLSGDFVFTPGATNANGIARTPDGRDLLVVQSNTGLLFTVDADNGAATQVDLGGVPMTNGDGLWLEGRRLYVVQNRLNQIAVVDLNRSGTRGTVVKTITSPAFDVPTTIAAYGQRLYLPNARFTTPPTPDTTYTAVAVRR